MLGVDVSEKKLVESGKHGVVGDIIRDFVLAGVETVYMCVHVYTLKWGEERLRKKKEREEEGEQQPPK